MRRVSLQLLRSARRPHVRSVLRNGANHRTRRDRVTQSQILASSMYFSNKSFGYAVLSGLVASGAYYAYRGVPTKQPGSELFNNPVSGVVDQTRGFATSNLLPSGASSSNNLPPAESPTQATRRALVVDQGQLYTGTITGDGPLSKTTDDYGRKVLEMKTPEQATQILRRNEQSYLVGRGKGVVRYDVVQLASNDPIEDDHAEKIVEVPQNITPAQDGASTNDWMFWGVFDGHSGWTTSAKLRNALITYVARELNSTYSSAKSSSQSPLPSPSSIDAAIKRGFVALDTSIVQNSVAEVLKSKSKPQAASLLAPALSGSCALLSFYDSASKALRVACTGDSRAVLGRRSSSNTGKWVALPLSVDQTGANEAEAERLRAEHPNEPNVVRNGRVLGGLEPTRAFGDATYKWTADIQERMKNEFFGRSTNPNIRTPPYVTAEPIVTTTQVEPEKGDFVVMATDGLWEMLSNEEVVGLVGQWLEKNPNAKMGGNRSVRSSASEVEKGSSTDSRANGWLQSWFGSKSGTELPVQIAEGADGTSGQRAPIRQQQWGISANGAPSSSRFVFEDKNVATHLIRNALGGGDRDMVCALLTLPSPYSRRYRDDLTVEVIFFGDSKGDEAVLPGEGMVTVNEEATAQPANDELKAKL